MADFDAFEANVRAAFSKVKDHTLKLENELREAKMAISRQNEEINGLRKQLENLLKERESSSFQTPSKKPPNKQVSTGNEGVLDIHSFIHSDIHSFIHSTDMHKSDENNKFSRLSSSEREIMEFFAQLPKQQFLTFLTIYQAIEESGSGFTDFSYLAKTLKVSKGCIRTYISDLMAKGAPIIKEKYNNKHVLLSLSHKFRALNLKTKLIDLFYSRDPSQTHLFSDF